MNDQELLDTILITPTYMDRLATSSARRALERMEQQAAEDANQTAEEAKETDEETHTTQPQPAMVSKPDAQNNELTPLENALLDRLGMPQRHRNSQDSVS